MLLLLPPMNGRAAAGMASTTVSHHPLDTSMTDDPRMLVAIAFAAIVGVITSRAQEGHAPAAFAELEARYNAFVLGEVRRARQEEES